jgi:ABC-2 type transport system ATP-binding protein
MAYEIDDPAVLQPRGGLAIEATGVRRRYKNHVALDGLDLSVHSGSVCALLGPNGAGKTTAVRILTTLLRPHAGRIFVAGCDVRDDPLAVRFRMGLVGQGASVDEILTGRQNLVMFGRLYRLTRSAAQKRADQLLERFDLSEAAHRSVAEYSGGMRRRLDLATSLILSPPVLFLDEPTTGLDPRARIDVWASITSLVGSGTTVLLTTQFMEEADQLADQIVVIDAGRVVARGTPDELKAKVGPDRVETIVRKPSLDEVFLQLTGQPVSTSAETTDQTSGHSS